MLGYFVNKKIQHTIMKKTVTLITIMMLFAAVSAQTDTMYVNFTGHYADNDQWIQLNSVKVQNLTRGWTEILFYPDTELVLIKGTGIQDRLNSNGLVLSQNMPNPFSGLTFVNLNVAEPGDVTLVVTDITGRVVEAAHIPSLQPGNHKMRVALSSKGFYFLSARQKGQIASIKMVNNGGNSQGNSIEYMGFAEYQSPFFACQEKLDFKGDAHRPYSSNDDIKYVGYAYNTNNQIMFSETVKKKLGNLSQQTINLSFREQDFFGNSCPSIPTVTDFDGNNYNTVLIGEQCWMRENLRTTHYADGTAISNGSPIDAEDSLSNTKPYYYVNPALDTTQYSFLYGYYYNWPAVMKGAPSSIAVPSGVQGVCPQNWHLPSDEEWVKMINYVKDHNPLICGGNSDNIAKALAQDVYDTTFLWIICSECDDCVPGDTLSPNNGSGFGAVPSGLYGDDSFNGSDFGAYFWTASGASSGYAYGRSLFYYRPDMLRIGYKRSNGFSVRCIRDLSKPFVHTYAVSDISFNSAVCRSEVENDGGFSVTARGVCWSTTQTPNLNGAHTEDGSGIGEFYSNITGLQPNTIYYVRAYAINELGPAYGEEIQFRTSNHCPNAPTVTDFDENVYETVQIGQQCWMKENLRSRHYADGTEIPLGDAVTSLENPYRYIYPNSDTALAGYLYNWAAVMNESSSSNNNPSGVQGVCPNGWHIPSDAEWTQLTSYVSATNEYVCGEGHIAQALAAEVGWENSNVACSPGYAHSEIYGTGFKAVPAGSFSVELSDNEEESFNGYGTNTYFWSSTLEGQTTAAYTRHLSYDNPDVQRSSYNFASGRSVRCIRN
jgi:uncharacterized protein (TIGR02145 family)